MQAIRSRRAGVATHGRHGWAWGAPVAATAAVLELVGSEQPMASRYLSRLRVWGLELSDSILETEETDNPRRFATSSCFRSLRRRSLPMAGPGRLPSYMIGDYRNGPRRDKTQFHEGRRR